LLSGLCRSLWSGDPLTRFLLDAFPFWLVSTAALFGVSSTTRTVIIPPQPFKICAHWPSSFAKRRSGSELSSSR
jgi:hypothetical protein